MTRKGLGEELHRHVATELGVARPVDLTHPSSTDGRDNLVGTKSRASREPHDGRSVA